MDFFPRRSPERVNKRKHRPLPLFPSPSLLRTLNPRKKKAEEQLQAKKPDRLLTSMERYERALQVRFGSVQFGLARLCPIRVPFCPGMSGSVRFGSVRFGLVRFGSVRFDSARCGAVRRFSSSPP